MFYESKTLQITEMHKIIEICFPFFKCMQNNVILNTCFMNLKNTNYWNA